MNEHYMGEGLIGSEKTKAYTTINNATYKGESRHFNFESYINTLQNAFEILAEFGEPVAEAKKVSDFLDHISVNHPMVSTGIAQINSNPAYKENFTAASNYLAAIIKDHKPSVQRDVKSIKADKNKGNSNGNGKKKNSSNGENRTYSPSEWKKLTPEEKAEIRNRRAARKKRKAAALSASKESEEENSSDGNDASAMSKKKKSKKKN